jgi:glycosyltransferase involved in cell wall biosynthesis
VWSQNKFGQFTVAQQIANQLQVPLISLEHTLPMPDWNDTQLFSHRQMRGDINIFISAYSRERWGWKEDEAEVIHHGIDTHTFAPADVEREDWAFSCVNDWINRDYCCGFAIWQEITGWPNQERIPTRVLGDTKGLSRVARDTAELVEHYQKCGVFLNTSTVSPIPTTVLEAMSCGCPVVSTDNCMIPEVVEHGKSGFLSNNPDQLRSYCQQLIKDKDMAKEMGANARKTIEEHFTLEVFLQKWDEVFRRLT